MIFLYEWDVDELKLRKNIYISLYYIIIHIKKTLRQSVMKTVLGEEKTAAAERILRKILKKEKTDIDEKKKNNAVDTEENIEAFKSAYCWKLSSKLNFDIQYNVLLKGGTTLIAQLSWVIYLTLFLTCDWPATDPQV